MKTTNHLNSAYFPLAANTLQKWEKKVFPVSQLRKGDGSLSSATVNDSAR